jgi:hypothetical protein
MAWCNAHLNRAAWVWKAWVWKAWIFAAAITFLDAASILVPGVFGPLNFAHHGRTHAYSVLIQGTCFVALGLALRQLSQRTHKLEKGSV